MKRIAVLLLILMLTIPPVWAKRLYREAEYQKVWCEKRGGVMEYVIRSKARGTGRVDCMLPDMAVEVDFANKWHDCLGQALDYSAHTRKTAACLLIVEKDKDWKYVRRLRYTIQKKAPGTRTFTIKPEDVCDPAKRADCPHVQN